jgi:predicted enzyme related to lactoylglutathione lyase
MSLVIKHMTFDCSDPGRLARFWSEAVRGSVADDRGDFVVVQARSVGVRHLAFARVPEGKAAKNRVHIDFQADDRPAEVSRLESIGARVLSEHSEWGLEWTVLADPEGNEFCVAS